MNGKDMAVCGILGLCLILSPGPRMAHAQGKVEERLSGLEVSVVKIEKRVARLESGRIPAALSEKMPGKPIAAVFIKKEKIVKGRKLALKLFVELENITNRRFEAFSGKIVFLDGAGEVLYEQEYARGKLFEGGEKLTLAVTVKPTDSRVKAYLKLLKAPVLAADFVDQKFY